MKELNFFGLTQKERVKLIKKAQKLYGEIFPCVNKPSLEECFTFSLDGEPILWFNTQDKSTHMVTSDKIAVYDVLKGGKTRQKKKNSFSESKETINN